MANQHPSTPVKVPSSAANYTPATLDPDLRSQINAILWRDGHVTKIQEHLLHALHANPSNWPTQVQSHALNLLRSGEVTTFPALLRRVMDDVRQDTTATAGPATATPAKATNGADINGKKVNGETGTTAAAAGLAIPAAVIEEALKVTRESLEMVCEIDENGAT